MTNEKLRVRLACFLLAVLALLILSFIGVSGAGNRDVVSYWAASRLLVLHQNPYDAQAIYALEKSVGCSSPKVLMVRNVPLFLSLILPLGYLPFPIAASIWFVLILGCLIISIHLLRQDKDRTHLVGYIFAPAMVCLMAGQSGLVMLLGVALFFRFRDDPRSKAQFVAGAGLVVILFKPHLFVIFGIPLCGWMLMQYRRWILAGLAVAVAALQFPFFWHSGLWSGYVRMLRSNGIENEFIPALGGTLRVATRIAGLQVIPLLVAFIWVLWYFARHRRSWSWDKQGLVVLVVSLVVTPYAWITDEVVLMPAIFRGLYASEKAFRWFVAINLVAMVEILAGVQMPSGAYCWTPLAWGIWYVLAVRSIDRSEPAMIVCAS